MIHFPIRPAALVALTLLVSPHSRGTSVTGTIIDDTTGRVVPARLYIQGADGTWFFAESASPDGSSVRYDRKSGLNTNSVERHVTLSAHPFKADLKPGRYTFTVERGKEFLPLVRSVEVGDKEQDVRLPIHRWVNMASRGWYSGDTHVHRDPLELRNAALAEDVNVVHPMVWWTTVDAVPPSASPNTLKRAFPEGPESVDPLHVIHPRNTEYEIFTTAGRRHTLGAFLVINHRGVFDMPVAPLGPVAARARADGALIDLEKHNWEWSAAIVPIIKPDLFELANNHIWRVDYAVKNWAVPAPAWMNVGRGTSDEREWTLYGFQTWYMYMNCGFPMRPTAGTAHGVHPVPLGFGRVYVHLDGTFQYDDWMRGLKAGRSFVTTGPMLLARIDGRLPGERFPLKPGRNRRLSLDGELLSEHPDVSVEWIRDGRVVGRAEPRMARRRKGGFAGRLSESITVDRTGWIAVRCWEKRTDGRTRFAHSAAWFVDAPDRPAQPDRAEVEYLAQRVRDEMERSKAVLNEGLRREYEQALAHYEGLLHR